MQVRFLPRPQKTPSMLRKWGFLFDVNNLLGYLGISLFGGVPYLVLGVIREFDTALGLREPGSKKKAAPCGERPFDEGV